MKEKTTVIQDVAYELVFISFDVDSEWHFCKIQSK